MELTKKDYENINNLIKISNRIMELYKKLYQLEIEGKKESNEYQLIQKEIKKQLICENGIYEEIGNSFFKINAILSYLMQDNKSLKHNYSKQLINFDESLVIFRIVSKLSNSIENGVKEFLPFDDKILDSSFKVRETIILDVINCFLAVINSLIENCSNQYIENQLKKVKYTIGFLYPNIAEEMLKNNFEVDSNPYISYRFIGQINKWSSDDIEEIKKLYIIDYYKKLLLSILTLDDEDLKDKEILIEMLINQSFLRAIFILLNDETIMDLNSEFHDLLDEEDLQDTFENREEVIDYIIKAYKKVKADRSIPKTISLKL